MAVFQRHLRFKHFIALTLCALLFSCMTKKGQDDFEQNKYNNQRLAKDYSGFYLDTCLTMIFDDIQQSRNIQLGDFRILTHQYETPLATIPRDTSNNYFSISVIYKIMKQGNEESRAAVYLINMKKNLKKIYDVNTEDEKAKGQLEQIKADLLKLKEGLKKMPDSLDKDFKLLKEKLESVKQ
jgi:hypothetical protein